MEVTGNFEMKEGGLSKVLNGVGLREIGRKGIVAYKY